MSRISWRAWLGAAAIFVAGFVGGGTTALLVGGHVLRQRLHAPLSAPAAADRAAARIGAELSSTLDLEPGESARIQALLDESANNLKSIRVRAVEEAREEVRNSTRRIAAELAPDDRARFYRIVSERFQRLGMPPPVADE